MVRIKVKHVDRVGSRGFFRGMEMSHSSPSFIGTVLKHIACTPNKNPDHESYERGVLEPAGKIRAIEEQLAGAEPSAEQIREVMDCLLTIFETKGIDLSEREDRIRETFELHDCQHLFPNLLPLGAGDRSSRSPTGE